MAVKNVLHQQVETAQDVAGWKSIVFLPFHALWQVLIMLSIFFVFFFTTLNVTYELENKNVEYALYLGDLLYLTDVFCSILHRILKNTRKLKIYQPRPLLMLVIDCFSLIPFELIYLNVYYSCTPHSINISNFLRLNRSLRIYRFYYYCIRPEMSTQSLQYSNAFTYLEVISYGFIFTHIAACIFQRLKTEEEKKLCPPDNYVCILLNELNIYFLMSHRFIGNESTYDTINKRIACCVFMTLGHFFTYGWMVPKFIFSAVKRLTTFFEFWNRYKRLIMFVKNMIEDENLQKKILDEFKTVWTYGKGDTEPDMLKAFPTNLRKNVYSDIYWDAIRHSEILQNLSYGCKRSLALKFVGDFYMPGTKFWDIGEQRGSLIYLSSGILQIMAEENSDSPIMSFSGGTILGEATLFYHGASKAILRVATFSEIHVLRSKDLFHVIKDYPKDRQIMMQTLRLRIQIAKMTQIRKREISKVIFDRKVAEVGDFLLEEDDSVKWIKTQFRRMSLIQELQARDDQDYFESKTTEARKKRVKELKTGIDHTSIYLPLLNLGEDIEILTNVTCLKTSLPWVIDPTSHFIMVWRNVNVILVLVSCTIYPVAIAWWDEFPEWLNNLSQSLTLMYMVDIFLQLSTAIKTKSTVIVHSGAIFRYRLKTFSFYADVISAIPVQFTIKLYEESENSDFQLRVGLALSLLRSYKLILFLNEWCEASKGRFSLRVMLKYLLIFGLWVYWSAAGFYFLDVKCRLWPCHEGSWYKPDFESIYPEYKMLASVFFSVNIVMDVPDTFDYTQNFPSIIFIVISMSIVNLMCMLWVGDYTASYMLQMSQEIEFKTILQSVVNFMNERNIIGRIKKRVMDTLFFHWYYDAGDYMTKRRAMLEDASEKLKREVDESTIYKVIKSCQMLQFEEDEFIWHICSKCLRLALPANSIVVTYGVQTMTIYIIYKGYIQVNSFLPRDTLDGLASPLLYKKGNILPLVVALNQMPSSITGRTLTDCELIAISLEDFLTGMVLSNSFKDFVDVSREMNLEPFRNARLTISKVDNPFNVKPVSRKPFAKLKFCGWILRLLLTKGSIRGDSTFYLRWEIFRLIVIIIDAIFWPVVYELPVCSQHHKLVYGLLILDSCAWLDFYFKFHLGFYNKIGIYVTDPAARARHYLKTSFILDAVLFTPYLQGLILMCTTGHFHVNHKTVIIHSMIRLLSLHRLFLFITSKENIGNFIAYLKGFGYLLILFTSLNCMILLKVRMERIYHKNPDGTVTVTLDPNGWIKMVNIPSDTLGSQYLIILYCFLMLFFRAFPFFKDFTSDVLVCEITFALFGMVTLFFGHAFFLSRVTGAKMNFTIYQFHMKSLTRFLKAEKAEDSISNAIIGHFEHEWERKKGEDLHKVFSRFPNVLEEDLIYPIYRRTLNRIPCFTHANEAFFRNLSRLFIEVHFKKGATIMFKNSVNNEIYFIHKGQCFVRGSNAILGKGSMMGDIMGKGKTMSTILAKTHVMLLMIKSPKFLEVLNKFYQTEKAYFNKVKSNDDFVQSGYVEEVEEDARDVSWTQNVSKPVECEFELAEEEREPTEIVKSKKKKKHPFQSKIHPNSFVSKILRIVFVLDAIVTSFAVPLIIGLHLATITSLVLIYFLDSVWILKIIVTSRTIYIAKDTGNMVTSSRKIFMNYLRTPDGFIVDILSVFPFEYVYKILMYFFEDLRETYLPYCYTLRLLRLLCLWIYVKREKKKLNLNDRTRWFIIIMRQLISYIILTAVHLRLATKSPIRVVDHQTEYTYYLKNALIWSYMSMFNVYAATGLYIFPPENLWQISYQIIVAILSIVERSLLTSEVLSLINVSLYTKSKNLVKMQLMDKYLTVRDLSPALKQTLSSYAKELLDSFDAQIMPWFLKTSPYYIKVQIMQDLYKPHLLKCQVFQDVDNDFLIQVAARLTRYVYSPADVIVEEGDVDNTMYFIHKGEVASIEKNPFYLGLDYQTASLYAGDNFGIEQGMSRLVPHSSTFRAITVVDLLSLNFYDWEDLRVAFPEVTRTIFSKMKKLEQDNFVSQSSNISTANTN